MLSSLFIPLFDEWQIKKNIANSLQCSPSSRRELLLKTFDCSVNQDTEQYMKNGWIFSRSTNALVCLLFEFEWWWKRRKKNFKSIFLSTPSTLCCLHKLLWLRQRVEKYGKEKKMFNSRARALKMVEHKETNENGFFLSSSLSLATSSQQRDSRGGKTPKKSIFLLSLYARSRFSCVLSIRIVERIRKISSIANNTWMDCFTMRIVLLMEKWKSKCF